MTAVLACAFLLGGGAARGATWYVATNGSDAAAGTNWLSAKQTIQAAVDIAVSNDVVLVSNGVYATGGKVVYGNMTNRVAIDRPVVVRSVNGPSVTAISGGGSINNDAVRCVYVGAHAMLEGFTLSGGRTRGEDQGDWYHENVGGGAWCEAMAVLSNSVITGCIAYGDGGGVFGGTLYDCTLVKNTAQWSDGGGAYTATLYRCVLMSNTMTATYGTKGAGAAYSTLYNCLLRGNTTVNGAGGGAGYSTLYDCTLETNVAANGGGADRSVLSNCVLTLNRATSSGGGVYRSLVLDSVLTNNVAANGGGAHGARLERCLVANNRASASGGGTHSSTNYFCMIANNAAVVGAGGGAHGGAGKAALHNSLVFGNTAPIGGGVLDVGMYNCTVAGNTAATRGGGLYVSTFGWSSIRNCIIYSNTAPADANWYTESVDAISATCTTPQPAAPSNITNAPQFVDLVATNLRLQATSPCVNIGDDSAVTTALDLDGNPRISGGTVDMGAYELQEGATDTDGDDIPDWWESQHYGGPTNANPNAMASNGVNTVLEAWIADLNPTNPASVFVITTVSNAPGGAASVVATPGSTGRIYQLYSTTDLSDLPQTWPPFGAVQTGTGAGVTFFVTNEVPYRDYRTGVQVP